MNALRASAAKHAQAVNALAGERLVLRPQLGVSRGGGAGGADSTREEAEFVGTVTRRPIVVQRAGAGALGGTNAQLADAKWQVGWPAALRLASGERLIARAGDHVERLDPPAGEPATLLLHAALSIAGRTIHPADPVAS